MFNASPDTTKSADRCSPFCGGWGGGDDAGMMGAGFLHVSDVLVEITCQFGGLRQVHEEGPLVVGGRDFFFLSAGEAGEADVQREREQADKFHEGNVRLYRFKPVVLNFP